VAVVAPSRRADRNERLFSRADQRDVAPSRARGLKNCVVQKLVFSARSRPHARGSIHFKLRGFFLSCSQMLQK
jgi:hypothetical protein